MNRREFVVGSAAACAAAAVAATGAEAQGGRMDNQYYELRTYHLRKDARKNDVEQFLANAAIPALKRMGVGPVGVFLPVEQSADDPTLYVLLPHKSLDAIYTLYERLATDFEFLQAGEGFLSLPSTDPGYVRIESSLMRAFDGMPTLEAPKTDKPRIFELRTYENHSEKAHLAKVGMFNQGEIAIFRRTGLKPVFFGSTMIGGKMPNLTYMLTFDDMAAHDKAWGQFIADPDWKVLSQTPGLTDKEIVSKITRTFLKPAACSQI